ncbi:MAG: hypothetical protein L3J66_04810 [Bacteroidales bacterium]|nr:hypothetical protein [Bacteroidales bacterium]
MKKIISHFLPLLFAGLLTASSCNKGNINPNIPDVVINLTIDPNSTQFLELNTVGGWLYLDEVPGIIVPYPSMGVIVYRYDVNEFKAYERQPPNEPFKCCDDKLGCTKLIINDFYPFVKDTCNGNVYQLLDGTLFEGQGHYSLIRYNAVYDGALLHVYN